MSTFDTPAQKPLVILIHGLHQRGFIMQPLANRLKKRGYSTHSFDYRSLADSITTHSRRLNDWLEQNHSTYNLDHVSINIVAHSLGGLVARDFISRYPQWSIDKCVTLGTPHLGSISAKYVRKLMPPLVGNAYKDGLDGTINPLPDDVCLGVIAGSSPRGLGQFFLNHYAKKTRLTPAQSVHDGTVFEYETRLPNATDHIVLPVSHTGMLMNKDVAYQTAYFIEHGKFDKSI